MVSLAGFAVWLRSVPTVEHDAGRVSGGDTRTPICLITLRGQAITAISPRADAARALTGQRWSAALSELGIDLEVVAESVEKLTDHGIPFVLRARSGQLGLLCLKGWTEGLEAKIALFRCSDAEQELYGRLQDCRAELQSQRDIGARAETSPVPAVETDAQGRIVWTNQAAERLLRRGVNRVALAQIDTGASRARMQLLGSDGRVVGWARATTAPTCGGGRITHLEDIDGQVQAEQALEGFMATLAETFAHLEQGLGIFDRDRKLTLFNPSLAEMFGLDPVLLAKRPSLRHFLEALRQRRMVPEQKDFTDWRGRFIEASDAAGPAPYTEDWPLPSGRILQVCARQHPRGALAFIFKDISDQVLLESRYRAEIETTQATLESLDEAVAVFGACGQITYANPAFSALMGGAPMDGLTGAGIDAICADAARHCKDAETWRSLRDYILASERSETWHGLDHAQSGGMSVLRARALPDGATLLTINGGAATGHGGDDEPQITPQAAATSGCR